MKDEHRFTRDSVANIQNYLEEHGDSHSKNKLERALAERKFRKKLINKLKQHNIGAFENQNVTGESTVSQGRFSWIFDIGEGQVLHISSPKNENKLGEGSFYIKEKFRTRLLDKIVDVINNLCIPEYEPSPKQKGIQITHKPHIRYNEPEILQPIAILCNDADLKIEVLPKVKTDKITPEHVNALVSSLAKKGLIFADCKAANIGLIEISGKEIPVVIGDGSVIGYNKNELKKEYYPSGCSNLEHFRAISNFYTRIEATDPIQYFKDNQDYIHYDWVDPKTNKWAQEEYLESQGLTKGKVKGIIPRAEIEAVLQQDLHPLAKEIMEEAATHCLRQKDVARLSADRIAEKWGDKFKDKEDFKNFVSNFLEERKKSSVSLV